MSKVEHLKRFTKCSVLEAKHPSFSSLVCLGSRMHLLVNSTMMEKMERTGYLEEGWSLRFLTLWQIIRINPLYWESTETWWVWPSTWSLSIRRHLLNTHTGTKHPASGPLREKPYLNHSPRARMYSWQDLLAAFETYVPTLPGLPLSSI